MRNSKKQNKKVEEFLLMQVKRYNKLHPKSKSILKRIFNIFL